MSSPVMPGSLEQSLTVQELEWLVVGVHEAGHVYLAKHAGLEVSSVSMNRSWFFGDVSALIYYRRQTIDDDQTRGLVVACYGGKVAEERFLVEYGISARSAASRAEQHCGTDMELARRCSEDMPWSQEECRAAAVRLVDQYWPRIILLGALICENGRLSRAEASRVKA
jgi:hypothetical protein